MNSAVRRFTLFFLSLALITACEDPSDIGLDLQDDNKIGTFYTDTLTINTGTVLHSDSIPAFKPLPMPLGGYWDSALGNVLATAFTEVGLSGLDLEFGENPVADSIVLTLDYNTSVLYGVKQNAPLTLSVHRLTEGFNDKKSYFTNSTMAYESQPLGTTVFQPKIVQKQGTAGGDSAIVARIKLDKSLAEEILSKSGQAVLKDQFKFVEFFKGIAIVPSAQNSRVLMAVEPASSRTKITLYYRNGADKKEYSFFMGASNIRSFSRIVSDRSGTVLQGLQKYQFLPSEQTGGETYVQAGTQLFTKLTIPYIKELKAKHGNIVINRAELVLPVKTNSFATLETPTQLAIYETNATNKIFYTAKGEPKTVPVDQAVALENYSYPNVLTFKKGATTGTGYYTVNITAYVQGILNGKKANQSMLVTPAKLKQGPNGTGVIIRETVPFRAIITDTEQNPVRLRVYFSKLD
jgi:hypothetical protein